MALVFGGDDARSLTELDRVQRDSIACPGVEGRMCHARVAEIFQHLDGLLPGAAKRPPAPRDLAVWRRFQCWRPAVPALLIDLPELLVPATNRGIASWGKSSREHHRSQRLRICQPEP
jgi:hypothetical protein